jgi:hypothetical protein
LTALPNAAAEAAGGLYTRGTGAGQINQNANGQVDSRTVGMANDTITAAAIATGAIDADAIADNAIDAGAIAADAITAAKLHADVTTELQNGLATAANLATVAGYIDTEVASILAAVDTEIATLQTSVDDLPTNAELATALGTADDAVLAQVALVKTETDKIASIKTKTDQFVFTVANQVDANALTGGGGLNAAQVRAAVGLASANLDTQLDALPTAAENATAILSAADSNPIASNVKEVNDVALQGDGSAIPWGPV